MVEFLVEAAKTYMEGAVLDGTSAIDKSLIGSLPMLYKIGIATLPLTISLFWYDIKSFFVVMLYEKSVEVNDLSRRVSSGDTRANVATIRGLNHLNLQDDLLSTANASNETKSSQ